MDNAGKLIISIISLAIFSCFGAYIFFKGVSADSHDIVLQMEGALITWVTSVISYWVGSSAGSANKDQTIREQLPNPGPTIPPPKVD